MGVKEKKTQIIPAILEKRFLSIKKRIEQVQSFAEYVQIDVADGEFVKNKTFLDVSRLQLIRSNLSIELHLMVNDPKTFILPILSNIKIDRIIIQIESFKNNILNLLEVINLLRRSKKEVGLALNPATSVYKILSWIELVDEILFLSVQPGRQGNKFQHKVLKKMTFLQKHDKDVIIGIDGGITDHTIRLCKNAGATRFYVGSYIFATQNPSAQFQTLKHIIE